MPEYLSLFVTVFLGSGAAIAIARMVVDKQKEARERRDALKYLATLLAFHFEAFALMCAQVASDHELAASGGGKFISRVPEPAALPVSDSFRFVDIVILNDVFAFGQRCQMAQRDAAFWSNVVGDDECYMNAAAENTIAMGAEALRVARSIRTNYDLGLRPLMFGKWDIEQFFSTGLEKISAANVMREKAMREYERVPK